MWTTAPGCVEPDNVGMAVPLPVMEGLLGVAGGVGGIGAAATITVTVSEVDKAPSLAVRRRT
jgi:hypothetical protein